MPLVKACTKSDVSEGSLKSLSVSGKDLVVAMINGKFYAMDNWCTHEQGNLSDGVLNKTVVTCPEHGAQFDITNGLILAGPDGEPPGNTPSEKVYKVEVQENDVMVQIP